MRKISASVALVMLLVLTAPVLTYAASILDVYYDAATGRISGVIYSDKRDISLSLDNGREEYPVSPEVLGEVQYSDTAHVFWAEVNGQLAAGLNPGILKIRAGDEKQVPVRVTDTVYSFNTPFSLRAPVFYNDLLAYNIVKDKHKSSIDVDWYSMDDYEMVFGRSHYNVYIDGVFYKSTMKRYIQLNDLPYHSQHNVQVTAVDWFGNESEKSSLFLPHAPGYMDDVKVLFSGSKGGTALQPLDGLVSFRPYSESLSINNQGYRLQLYLTDAFTYDYVRAPYTINESQLSASDFELVKDDGTVIPVQSFRAWKGTTITFEFSDVLDSDAYYTLRLSATATGDEIALPLVNTRQVNVSLFLTTNDGDEGRYFFHFNDDISIGTFPNTPTNLAASGDGKFNVTWDSNKEADLVGYLVWLDGKLLTESPIQKTNYSIEGLTNGKKYHVNVAAVNKDGGRSLQAYIFPVPLASTGTSNPGPGGGGGGAPAVTDTTTTAPVLSVVDKAGVTKSLNTVLKSENNKVTVSVVTDVKQLLLPVATEVINKDNALVVTKDDVSLEIPGSVLEQLKGSVSADQLKNARISAGFTPISAEDIAKITGKSANTVITVAGVAYDFTLSLLTTDGKETKLTQFNAPITLKLKVNESSNSKLTGVYYLSEKGELQYIGGQLDNGYLTVVISHFSKYAVLQYDKSFSDVPSTHWASQAIKSMLAQQVVTGTSDTTFSPNQQVTRAEFAAFIARKLNLKATGASRFADVASSKWYADEVAAVTEAGIVSGQSEAKFAPERTISRQEMVVMLMKAYVYKNNTTLNAGESDRPFADGTDIAGWAKPYATAAQKLGFLQGSSGNRLEPHKNATRAEAVQLISKL
ncbi:hypothetical protein HGO21_07560 [Acinetobacter sp. CUI P1]|nr:hypothetical protein [Acinetobacter sp. CUI P1]